jgi:hypothetical protein
MKAMIHLKLHLPLGKAGAASLHFEYLYSGMKELGIRFYLTNRALIDVSRHARLTKSPSASQKTAIYEITVSLIIGISVYLDCFSLLE